MKKLTPIIIIISALLLTACGAAQKTGKPVVYSSFYAVDSFAAAVCGDDAEHYSVTPVGGEPHDFEPTARDMAKISEADLFIYNGLGIDSWAEDVVKSIPDTVSVVCLSDILDSDIIIDADPHIWLDGRIAAEIVTAISGKLAEIDGANADKYMERGDAYAEEINGLYDEYARAGLDGKKLFVTHGAYAYLCDSFGMEQTALEGTAGESDPSPARTAKFADKMKASGAKCVFYDPLEGDKTAAAVAAEAGVEALPLYTFEGDTEGRDYVTIMRLNLEQLKKGL